MSGLHMSSVPHVNADVKNILKKIIYWKHKLRAWFK
jgi:hypothetical protein